MIVSLAAERRHPVGQPVTLATPEGRLTGRLTGYFGINGQRLLWITLDDGRVLTVRGETG